jgi:DNA-binding NarL/FixJ family response regulator
MPTSTAGRIRIVIVDDHAVVRTGLSLLIERHSGLTVVGEAANRADALAVAAREQPDIILLDLDLRGESGLDLLPELCNAVAGVRVIVLTGMPDSEKHRKAVRLGAMGLVLKEHADEVLIKAIEKVHAGEIWIPPAMVASVLADMSRPHRAAQPDPEAARIASLTSREREVIALIGEGLKNKQIAARLSISEATVSHHLTSIFEKLGAGNRFDLVIYAYRHGLAHPPR